MKHQDTYKTILVICTGILVFYFFTENKYWFYAVLTIGVASIVFPYIAQKITQLWFKLATALGWLNARILLTAIFFLVLFPVALLRKIFTSKTKAKENPESYYVVRNHAFTSKDMENTW